jgi:hypothetical protein
LLVLFYLLYYVLCPSFFPLILGITKLDKVNNQSIRGKNWGRESSKGNKTVPARVATTRTEDGHK